jgi:hypothetical protein
MKTRIALVALAFVVAGCQVSHWRTMALTPEAVTGQRPHEVRVTRTDGSRVTLFDPELAGDTLRGLTNPTSQLSVVRIAVRDVRTMETRHVKVGASTGLSVLAILGTLVVTLIVVCSTGSSCGPSMY